MSATSNLSSQTNDSGDPRIGNLLGVKITTIHEAKLVLLGFPSDAGVARNHGRRGAAKAPNIIRKFLNKLTPDPQNQPAFIDLIAHSADQNDLFISGDIQADQDRLAEELKPYLEDNCIPIILGGGHETSFGHFQAYVKANKPVSILNWDAHTDVRPLHDGEGHSGSPFRQALESPGAFCSHYVVAGLNRHSTAKSHLDFIRHHNGRYYWHDDISIASIDKIYNLLDSPCMVSFDVDAVQQANAPGVSAPSANGLSPQLWLYAAYRAGQSTAVSSMDIVEFNPYFDRDHQTARLVALSIWYFLSGVAQRKTFRSFHKKTTSG